MAVHILVTEIFSVFRAALAAALAAAFAAALAVVLVAAVAVFVAVATDAAAAVVATTYTGATAARLKKIFRRYSLHLYQNSNMILTVKESSPVYRLQGGEFQYC